MQPTVFLLAHNISFIMKNMMKFKYTHFWSIIGHSFKLKWELIYGSDSLEKTDLIHIKINLNIKSVCVAQI